MARSEFREAIAWYRVRSVAVAHQSRRPGYWKDRLPDDRIGLARGEFKAPDDIDGNNAEVAARFNGQD